jgi:hypothetical protein
LQFLSALIFKKLVWLGPYKKAPKPIIFLK